MLIGSADHVNAQKKAALKAAKADIDGMREMAVRLAKENAISLSFPAPIDGSVLTMSTQRIQSCRSS